MKPGDIVITLRDLDWINDSCVKGTRMRLIESYVNTEGGIRWSGRTKNGHVHRNIPPDEIEVIA